MSRTPKPPDSSAHAPDLYDLIEAIKIRMIELDNLIAHAQKELEVDEPNLTSIQTQQAQLEVLFKSLKDQGHTLQQPNSPTQLRIFRDSQERRQPPNHVEESAKLVTEMFELPKKFAQMKQTIQNKFGTQIARLERSGQPSCCSIS
jgi:hypothetical protein